MDQAIQEGEEWSVPEGVKRQRTSESLKSLTADVICSLTLGRPDSVVIDYIEALCAVY